ncbi:MAG: hypothetical protein HZB33_01600 [Nitrospirae bacterium]|nr:hypothetical protein [Nitrospirota bacterium]
MKDGLLIKHRRDQLETAFYDRLKEKALEAARRIGQPGFYREYEKQLKESSDFFDQSVVISRCLRFLDEAKLHPAHGISHCEKVAREAGALLRIERRRRGRGEKDEDELMLCAQIAGLFHDIKRSEEDHPLAGSLEAEKILGGFEMEGRHKRYIIAAIRNHEAFKKVMTSEDEAAGLVSDSLYDADKFRWGPDNFTATLWLITGSGMIPVKKLFECYEEKLEGILRIKETFRTETGRIYGPEFIDLGLEIGREIYREMRSMLGDS